MIEQIKNKKVLIFGLGILGGSREAVRWFYKNGAKIIITDKKTKKELLPSIKKLKKIKAKYVLGKHRFKDIDSSFIFLSMLKEILLLLQEQEKKQRQQPGFMNYFTD